MDSSADCPNQQRGEFSDDETDVLIRDLPWDDNSTAVGGGQRQQHVLRDCTNQSSQRPSQVTQSKKKKRSSFGYSGSDSSDSEKESARGRRQKTNNRSDSPDDCIDKELFERPLGTRVQSCDDGKAVGGSVDAILQTDGGLFYSIKYDDGIERDALDSNELELRMVVPAGDAPTTSSAKSPTFLLPSPPAVPNRPSEDELDDPLPMVSLEKAQRKRKLMLKIEEKIKTNPDFSAYLEGVDDLSRDLVDEAHAYITENPIRCRNLTPSNDRGGGSYRFKDDEKTRSLIKRTAGKSGQTQRDFSVRTKEQIPADVSPFDVVSVVFSREEIVAFVHEAGLYKYVIKILQMKPPGLQYGDGHIEDQVYVICAMITEKIVACCHVGYTHEVFEQITSTPSRDVEALVAFPTEYNAGAVRILRQAKEIRPLLSWETAGYYLERIRDDQSTPEDDRKLLASAVKSNHEDGFAKWHLIKQSYGNNPILRDFVDAVPGQHNPVVERVGKVGGKIKQLFTPSIIDEFVKSEELVDIEQLKLDVLPLLNEISNMSSYESPSDDQLLLGTERELLDLTRTPSPFPPDNVLITMEFTLFNLLKEKSEKYDSFFPVGTKFYNQYDYRGHLATTIAETPRGRPNFQIVFSYFIMVAGDATHQHRFNAAARLLCTTSLHHQAGLVSTDALDAQQCRLTTFAMNLVGLDGTILEPEGSYHSARDLMMPKGFHTRHCGLGTIATSKKLGVDSWIIGVLLRVYLGSDIFNAVLTALGYPSSRSNPSPIDAAAEYGAAEFNRMVSRESAAQMDKRTTVWYPPAVRNGLEYAVIELVALLARDQIPYSVVFDLLQSVLEQCAENRCFSTENMLFTKDNKLRVLKREVQTAVFAIFEEPTELHQLRRDSLLRLKEKYTHLRANANSDDMIDENVEIEKLAVRVVARIQEKTDSTPSASVAEVGRRYISAEERLPCTFPPESGLSHLKGWKYVRASGMTYYPPENDASLQGIPAVKRYLEAKKNKTFVAPKMVMNTNEWSTEDYKFDEPDMKHLTGYKMRFKTSGGKTIGIKQFRRHVEGQRPSKVLNSLNEVRLHAGLQTVKSNRGRKAKG